MTVRYSPNRSGMREYLRGGDYYSELARRAALIADQARASAKVESAESATRHGRAPGKFRDSIHVARHDGPSRSVARVIAECEGAEAIEARDRTLGRAAG